jgi:hypothetical protein
MVMGNQVGKFVNEYRFGEAPGVHFPLQVLAADVVGVAVDPGVSEAVLVTSLDEVHFGGLFEFEDSVDMFCYSTKLF